MCHDQGRRGLRETCLQVSYDRLEAIWSDLARDDLKERLNEATLIIDPVFHRL